LSVTVYTRDGCPECRATTMYLNMKGVNFVEKNIDSNEEFAKEALEIKASVMPTVIGDGHEAFSGFRPELLVKFT